MENHNTMDSIETLVRDLESARSYTTTILNTVDPADWYRSPGDAVTHIAWQVGHLAVAQYRLALVVVRGPKPDDEPLISQDFAKRFAPGSVPVSSLKDGPSVEEIRAVFERVHTQAVAETRELNPNVLDASAGFEHPMFSTKGGSIRWSAQHEFTHAGQISLLRRLLGRTWLW
ncbi:MAG: DinB family protein [Planctomycetaceae bacterium]